MLWLCVSLAEACVGWCRLFGQRLANPKPEKLHGPKVAVSGEPTQHVL